MEHIQTGRQKIIFEIEQLSNPYLTELQNFIQYLKCKQSGMPDALSDARVLRPEDDPVLRAFGMIDAHRFLKTLIIFSTARNENCIY